MIRLAVVVSLLWASSALANSAGVSGYSGAPPNNETCNSCHSGGGTPTVTLSGPTSLAAGATGSYTLTVSGGAGSRAGMDVSVSEPLARLNPLGASVAVDFGELHQSGPAPFSGGSVSFPFSLTAPPFAASLTLYGVGNSCNGDGNTSGDHAAATSLVVTVNGGSGMNPPVITMPPAAAADPVLGRSVALTVAANDDGTEANLSYSWSATGPAPVAFSPNGSNDAKASTAGFTEPGSYQLTVTVRDGTNQTATAPLGLTVQSSYSYLRLTPVVAQVAPGGTLQFASSQRDQFDRPVASPMSVTFQAPAGGGTIDASGLLKAQQTAGGPFVVTASAGSITTSATIGVGQAPPAPADHTAPTVTLTAPVAAGGALQDGLLLSAEASDDTGVAEVWFEVAQVKVGPSLTAPPWALHYTAAAGLPGGAQTLVAVARDIAGNVGRSSALPVQVPQPGAGGGAGSGGGAAGGGGGAAGGPGAVAPNDLKAVGGCSAAGGSLWLGVLAWLICALRFSGGVRLPAPTCAETPASARNDWGAPPTRRLQ